MTALKRPTVKKHSMPVVSKETETTRLWCSFTFGSPIPTVAWKRNGKIIHNCSPAWKQFINCSESSEKYKVFVVNNTFFLDIVQSTFPEDEGVYSCVAENEAGFASASVNLTVLGMTLRLLFAY